MRRPAIPQPLPLPTVVLSARDGDPSAQRELYERHLDAVHRYCLGFCRGDAHVAWDLLQESFARAFSSLDALDDPAAFPGWLMTITRRTCLRWIEQRGREQEALDRLAREPSPKTPGRERAAAVVAEVVEACPDERLRSVARLFYLHPPHSTQEIARQLGLSRTAVTTRLMRFRQWAKKAMLSRLAEALEEVT